MHTYTYINTYIHTLYLVVHETFFEDMMRGSIHMYTHTNTHIHCTYGAQEQTKDMTRRSIPILVYIQTYVYTYICIHIQTHIYTALTVHKSKLKT